MVIVAACTTRGMTIKDRSDSNTIDSLVLRIFSISPNTDLCYLRLVTRVKKVMNSESEFKICLRKKAKNSVMQEYGVYNSAIFIH